MSPARPRPTPAPTPYGPFKPGDIGGPHRSEQRSVAPLYEKAAPPNRNDSIQNQGTIFPLRLRGGSAAGTREARSSPAGESFGDFEGFGSLFRMSEFRRACDPARQLQNELSGVYFGYVDFEVLDLRGEAGLRICGNEFTLFNGERTASGQMATVTTSRYRAVAFRFTSVTGFAVPLLPLPKTISVRVNRSGYFRSTLEEPTKFAFSGGPRFRFEAPTP